MVCNDIHYLLKTDCNEFNYSSLDKSPYSPLVADQPAAVAFEGNEYHYLQPDKSPHCPLRAIRGELGLLTNCCFSLMPIMITNL